MSCSTGGKRRRGGNLTGPDKNAPAGADKNTTQRPAGSSRRRRMRGGMGYGFGGSIGTAGPVWNNSWGGEVTKAGTPVYDSADPQRGSSRRRRRRTGKKSRRRTMRGGMSVSHASAGFAGDGARGLAIYKDVGGSQPFSNDVVPLK